MSNVEAVQTAPAKGGGLAGMVVADSSICFVNGAEGILEYRGYDIQVLAEHSTFEEVAFLLWQGHLPTASEFEEMKMQSRHCRYLPPEIIATLRDLPRMADPMAVLRSAVSLLAHYDPESEEMTLKHTSTRPAGSWDRWRARWRHTSACVGARSR